MTPEGYCLVEGPPEVEDYLGLRSLSGLSPRTREQAGAALPGSWWACHVVHEESGRAVGMGRLLGDGGWYFHVVDMAVLPDHQRRGLGDLLLGACSTGSASTRPPAPTSTCWPTAGAAALRPARLRRDRADVGRHGPDDLRLVEQRRGGRKIPGEGDLEVGGGAGTATTCTSAPAYRSRQEAVSVPSKPSWSARVYAASRAAAANACGVCTPASRPPGTRPPTVSGSASATTGSAPPCAAGRRDGGLEEVDTGQRPGAVVDGHDVHLPGGHGAGEHLQRRPLRRVPGGPAIHEQHLAIAQVRRHRGLDGRSVLGPDHDQHLDDVGHRSARCAPSGPAPARPRAAAAPC